MRPVKSLQSKKNDALPGNAAEYSFDKIELPKAPEWHFWVKPEDRR